MAMSMSDTAHEGVNQKTSKLKHTIRHIEEIGYGCWKVSTLTEDGHHLSGFGAIIKQAIEDAHQKAQSYADYDYPAYRQVVGDGR